MLSRICRLRKTSQLLAPFYSLHSQSIQSLNPNNHKPPIYNSQTLNPFSTKSKQNPVHNFCRDGNFNETNPQSHLICLGCGVQMQCLNPKNPGFFTTPTPKDPNYKTPIYHKFSIDESEATIAIKMGTLIETVNPTPSDNASDSDSAGGDSVAEKPVVCARCHSLRHYGRVKDVSVEHLLPDFDFGCTVGRRLSNASGGRCVVLMVVDAGDFDGSFPKKVAKLVSETIEGNLGGWKEGKSGNVPRVVLVLSKLDLLPSSISPTRLEHWVRYRARECGASKLTSVHMVSAVRGWGVTNLIDDVVKLVGERGNVWAIGAQNAGKSTLINALVKHVSKKGTTITEAPVPGTTLGIIRMEGILPGKAKLFDTPGLLHPYHIATRLTRDEQKLVQISKELRPRTYRLKAGCTIHVAGLLRLDIEKLSSETMYVTVWASPLLPLHMGKTECADKLMKDNFGRHLQPPSGEHRIEELGKWVRKEFNVTGKSWDASSVDVAAAGVGWFAFGIKGEATVGVWTYEGVEVIQRNALLPHRSSRFEEAGFTVSKLVSESDKVMNRNQKKKADRSKSMACLPQ